MSTFDRSGALLEGIRISSGNNGLTFPPHSVISNSNIFDGIVERTEYAILADSLDPTKFDLEIADPDLIFRWVKNSTGINRFDYSQFSNRFLPLPGGPPTELGEIGNSPRLSVTPPDTNKLIESPIDIYIFNSTSRLVTFNIQYVGADVDFSDPITLAIGIVELSLATGNLNFSNIDIQLYEGKIVSSQSQNFLDRRNATGIIGQLSSSSSEEYYLFLNPKPSSNSWPRVRIDFGPYLTPISVPNEGSLGSPVTGTFTWSLDTGRVRFSDFDVDSNSGKNIYYDGLTQDSIQFTRVSISISGSGGKNDPVFTIPNIGTDDGQIHLDSDASVDAERFVIFAEEIDYDSVSDENHTLSGSDKVSLNSSGVVISSIQVLSQDHTTIYKGPTDLNPDFLIAAGPTSERPKIYRTSTSQIEDSETVAVFYDTVETDRYYWIVVLTEGEPSGTTTGRAYLDIETGDVYMTSRDLRTTSGKSYYYFDSVLEIENGSAVQFFRSGANGSGRPETSDFWIKYKVEDQLIVDNIGPFPFVTVPTVPIVDASLTYTVDGNKGFTGELNAGGDPNTEGLCYFLDLAARQFSFAERRQTEYELQKDASFIKFDNVMLSEDGLLIKIDGQDTTPGTDYSFDPTTGVIEFTTPVGENDPGNRSGILGRVVMPNAFIVDNDTFSISDVGKFLLISTGDNEGLYYIASAGTNSVVVTPDFISAGSVTADIKSRPEVLVDRIWAALNPPYKQFSLSRADSAAGPFTELEKSEFSVQENVAQIGLKTAANPGEVFSITYVALITDDNGATYTEENRTERALFKIRQETAISTVGSNKVAFNPNGKTVSTDRQIDCYVNGIVLDPDEGEFSFTPPGTLTLDRKIEDQTVIVNYWVEEASGGETSFNLQADQIKLDRPEINESEQTATFNGDQTNYITNGSVFFIELVEILVVSSVSYNSLDDVTVVTFETKPTISTTGSDILVSQPVTLEEETYNVDIIPEGTNVLSVQGNVTENYPAGTVIEVDDDPYYVVGSTYDTDFNKTRVVIAGSFSQNYIIPVTARSTSPIILPALGFSTSKSAHLDYPVTLVKMGITLRKILIRDVDYSISDGGTIRLTENLAFGDVLYIMYVGREDLPAETVLDLNYAFYIAPAEWNRLPGQKLYSTYNLYAPDTFFYRVETVDSFLPEANDYVRSSASTGASGPNISDAFSSSTKDAGTGSPWYNEQHLANLDTVMIRLLKYYNDLINIYEDILSNLDGRIVGGNNGRFRFDGNSHFRKSYEAIRNDIDDKYVFRSNYELIDFWKYEEIPEYLIMAVPSSISRLFSTLFNAGAYIIGDRTGTDYYEEVIGSYGIENLRAVGTSQNAKANHFFTSGAAGISTSIELTPQNGDPINLLPAFSSSDNEVDIYTYDGVLVDTYTVNSVSGTTLVLDAAPPLDKGSVLLKDPIGTYEPGADFEVNLETGQIINHNRDDGGDTSLLLGDQIIVSPLLINDPGLDPKRIPVLDGLEANDSGRIPEPRLKRKAEFNAINDELTTFSNYLSFGTVAADKITVTGSNIGSLFNVGDIIRWLDGPNAGFQRRIINTPVADSFVLNVALPFVDSTGSTFQVGSALVTVFGNQLTGNNIGNNFAVANKLEFMNGPNIHLELTVSTIVDSENIIVTASGGSLIDDPTAREIGFQIEWAVSNGRTPIVETTTSIVAREIGLLSGNADISPSTSLAQISTINSELISADLIITSYGEVIVSGTGTVTSTVLTDATADFTLAGVNSSSLVYIPSGSNLGLYRVYSVTATTITIVSSDPWTTFPAPGTVDYQIIQPESFLDSEQFGVVSEFMRETLDFYLNTISWYSSISINNTLARTNEIVARQSQITDFIGEIENILISGLYDVRYLWIQQRTNRRIGTLAQKLSTEEQTQENLQQIKSDQKKLVLMDQL